MPVSYYWNDTFSSYAPGAGIPSGWESNGLSTSQFVDLSSLPPPRPSVGWYERTGNAYQLVGSIRYPADAYLGSFLSDSITILWEGWSSNGQGLPYPLVWVTDPVALTRNPLVSIAVESDLSISCVITGQPHQNSLAQSVFVDTWQYYQLNVLVSQINVGGTNYYTVDCQLAVNGIKVVDSGGPLTTSLVVDPLVGPYTNQIGWTAPGGVTSYTGEFSATDGAQTIPFYANPAVTVNSRVSQVIAEVAKSSDPSNARVSQVIAEVMKSTTTSNARVSQVIVEIIKGNTGALVFPEYIKSHGKLSH